MASKKGIGITIVILATITATSFLIWFIPENNETTFIISDHETNLDNIKEIHTTLVSGIEERFQALLNENITPEEYINIAEISSPQINSQIIQLVQSDAPQQWQESYLNYIKSLKKFNSQIRETIVVANLINDGAEESEIQKIVKKVFEIKADSESFVIASDETRP